jgi:AraC-like DNA-binding protein
MLKRSVPAVDRALHPHHGVSRLGQPLSYNRVPAADLLPWVAYLYVTEVEVPEGYNLQCNLLNDLAAVRIQTRGDWTAETRDGQMALGRSAVYFGPHSKSMAIGVSGSFTSIGLLLRPGAGYTMTGRSAADFTDRAMQLDPSLYPVEETLKRLDSAKDPEAQVQVMEDVMRRVLAHTKAAPPDPVSARFEALAYSDPNASVAEFARSCGIGERQLERIVRRDFGMSPKKVLRRARALDMASYLRGVADEEEAGELELRYYDQSHLIREFVQLFGMSPRQFVAKPQPLMTIALESRQACRLAMMERLKPGVPRPWE